MTYSDIIKNWQEQKILSTGQLEKALYNFRIIFAYHSGKIENDKINYYDTREIFENGKVSSYTGDLRTLFEQQNQKDCYEFLKDKIANKEPLCAELVKSIHYELMKGTYDERRFSENNERPGEYKKHDYIVGKNEVGLPPSQIESEISTLLLEMNETKVKDVLKAGCYLHAVFENIHPFADGNGRVGRTLLNYYMMTHNHPPIVVFEENKYDYYKALEAFDTLEDLDILYEFMQNQCVKTWQRQNENFKDFGSRKKLE